MQLSDNQPNYNSFLSFCCDFILQCLHYVHLSRFVWFFSSLGSKVFFRLCFVQISSINSNRIYAAAFIIIRCNTHGNNFFSLCNIARGLRSFVLHVNGRLKIKEDSLNFDATYLPIWNLFCVFVVFRMRQENNRPFIIKCDILLLDSAINCQFSSSISCNFETENRSATAHLLKVVI